MADALPKVDMVFVGVGFTAAVIAREMKDSAIRMVGLERGRKRATVPDFQSPAMHDELNYAVRHGLMQDVAKETVTFRNRPDQEALPMRQLGSFLPGTDLGGAGVHWNGQSWRFQEADFQLRSHVEQRYGKNFMAPELTIQDWGLTYAELEPCYDRFEYLLGVCGQAGNVKGQIRPGGNPLEAPRARDYPNPPTKPAYLGALFAQAAMDLGYSPFQVPSSNMTRPYTNPEGVRLEPCMVCGYCERFGCEHFAKSSPQTTLLPVLLEQKNFELRTGAHVVRVELTPDRKHATGVTYVDLATGKEMFQPADLVVLSAWAYHNARLMLLSGIGTPYDPGSGTGVVGKNYAYQTMGGVTLYYDTDIHLNQFMGAGALGTAIDRLLRRQFRPLSARLCRGQLYRRLYDRGAADRVSSGAARHAALGPRLEAGGRPPLQPYRRIAGARFVERDADELHRSRPDLPRRLRAAAGADHLRLSRQRYPHVALLHRPRRRDRAPDGAESDHRGVPHGALLGRAVPDDAQYRRRDHGREPARKRGQPLRPVWDVSNVFVTGTALFPQNATYNPTTRSGRWLIGRPTRCADQYLKSPGPLVQA